VFAAGYLLPWAAFGVLALGTGAGRILRRLQRALMAALFALGVMSIAWMLLIAVEKLLPSRLIATGVTAAVLALLGVAIMFFLARFRG
jgi:predicted metal-binding membrane protein